MNAVKTQPQDANSNDAKPTVSGKLVIITVALVAIGGALFSWFFRYNATHRAAEFWGPTVSRAIRDSAVVEVYNPSAPVTLPEKQSPGTGGFIDTSELREISSARGLTHLRNALLEDRSFDWPVQPLSPNVQWSHGLIFGKLGEGGMIVLLFSRDFKLVTELARDQMLSCQPIANGLHEMFEEFAARPASDAAKKSR